MKKNKMNALTAVSAICGVVGFVVNLMISKDEEERIAERAAEIVMENQNESAIQ